MTSRLLVLGASARAAAFAGLRAGFTVSTVDLFADQDLRDCCSARIAEDYPSSLVRDARAASTSPWIYTGGLENHPEIVDRIARERPLYGNCGEALRRVRDPFQVQRCLKRTGIGFPETRPTPVETSADGSWLCKGYSSSGGIQVTAWPGEGQLAARSQVYFQRRVEGISCAAVYIGRETGADLIGVTRQLVGETWCHAAPYRYCGSIGPLALSAVLARQFAQMGDAITQEFSLRGIFGVDCIVAGDDLWAIEVNPRFPASAEMFDRVRSDSVIDHHVRACANPFEKEESLLPSAPELIAGKCILFAGRDFLASPSFVQQLLQSNQGSASSGLPASADIPVVGTEIRAGWPVVTLLENGTNTHGVEQRLRLRAQQLYAVMAAL